MGKAYQLTLATYSITATFPREEIYALASQMCRAASSIPSNIAEGCGRDGDAELSRFYSIARGSVSRLEYQILLARNLQLIQRLMSTARKVFSFSQVWPYFPGRAKKTVDVTNL